MYCFRQRKEAATPAPWLWEGAAAAQGLQRHTRSSIARLPLRYCTMITVTVQIASTNSLCKATARARNRNGARAAMPSLVLYLPAASTCSETRETLTGSLELPWKCYHPDRTEDKHCVKLTEQKRKGGTGCWLWGKPRLACPLQHP